MSATVYQLLRRQAELAPDAPAVLALDREPLSYAALLRQVEMLAGALAGSGVGGADRVAVVLSNGPEMVTCFLAVTAVAACAPLNPAYRAGEFAMYFDDLAPKALIAAAGANTAALGVAGERGIPVIELADDPDGAAGTVLSSCGAAATPARFAAPNDTALVLHTSGTTARPKMVPLANANLCSSAENIARSLVLTAADRCLSVMPLFHIHGLVGAVLSTISSGGSIACLPGFMAPAFFDWLGAFRPSWYTAVPTIHRAVLARAMMQPQPLAPTTLRFIRSCSAAMPPQLIADLEAAFGVPVIEAYGMTEASHQMACNPLPPEVRKPGSVGRASGTQVAIMGERQDFVGANQVGEIVVRGAGVTAGYTDNPEANAASFVDGWFRTGDQGWLDADGYIFISGRTKEIINRGGAKISPREVEETLMGHPAVAEAVAFAMPDLRLGEDVAAAVVLRPGAAVDDRQLRAFAAMHLADYKLPRRILFPAEIPKGPTGKVQRIGLAAKLGLVATEEAAPVEEAAGFVAPHTELEEQLGAIWRRILRAGQVGCRDDFFAAGGDSLSAVRMLLEIEAKLGIALSIADLFAAPTIEKLANLIGSGSSTAARQQIVRMQPAGARPPFFAIGAGPTMRELAMRLGPDQPFLGVQYPDFAKLPQPYRLEDIAAEHVSKIRAEQPQGPYYVGGWCIDGVVAYEVAQQLRAQSQEVGLLVLFDVPVPFGRQAVSKPRAMFDGAADLLGRTRLHARVMSRLKPSEIPLYFRHRLGAVARLVSRKAAQLRYAAQLRLQTPPVVRNDLAIQHRAAMLYEPRPLDCPVLLFRRTLRPGGRYHDARAGLDRLALGALLVHEIPGDHRDMFCQPQVAVTADALRSRLLDAQPIAAAQREVAASSVEAAPAGLPGAN